MLVYVAGPYSSKWGKIGEFINILKARRVASKLWRMGYTVICPHLNSALITGLTQQEWYLRDLKLLSKCHVIVMLPGWERSKGARIELDYARANAIVVTYWKTFDRNHRELKKVMEAIL